MALTEQHQYFCNRVERLERAHGLGTGLRRGKRQSGTRAPVYHVGLDETMSAEQMQRAMGQLRGKGKVQRQGPLAMLIGLPLSFVMGVLGVALAWWGIFAYTGGGTALTLLGDATLATGLVAVVAMGAVLLLRVFTGSRLTAHTLTQGLGVIAGVALLHNTVHLYPEQWAMLFSDSWVAQLRGVTQAQTLMLPGVSIPLPAVL